MDSGDRGDGLGVGGVCGGVVVCRTAEGWGKEDAVTVVGSGWAGSVAGVVTPSLWIWGMLVSIQRREMWQVCTDRKIEKVYN